MASPTTSPSRGPRFARVALFGGSGEGNATIPHHRDTSQTSRPVGGPLQKMGKWDLDFSTVFVLEGFSSILGQLPTVQSTQISWIAGFVPSNQKRKRPHQYRDPWVSRSFGHQTVELCRFDDGRDGVGVWAFRYWRSAPSSYLPPGDSIPSRLSFFQPSPTPPNTGPLLAPRCVRGRDWGRHAFTSAPAQHDANIGTSWQPAASWF